MYKVLSLSKGALRWDSSTLGAFQLTTTRLRNVRCRVRRPEGKMRMKAF